MKVGVVKTVIGHVSVVSVDGILRQLSVGDTLYESEVLSTGASSAIEVFLVDDSTMALGRNTQIELTASLF